MFERRLSLDAIRFLNSRCFVLAFRSSEIAAAARPGQFLMLSVTDGIDPLLRRPMAFYEILGPQDAPSGFSILVERTGRGTTLLSQLSPGDGVDVLAPLGTAFRPPTDSRAEAVLVMGGVGSAPFPLFASALLAAGHTVHAFIGGRTQDHLLCARDLEALGVGVTLATDDGSAGHHGLVTEPLTTYLESAEHPQAVYSCGPTPMMRAVDRIAAERGLPHQVSLEAPMACGIGVCLSCVVPTRTADGGWRYRRICREGPVFDADTLLWEHPDG
jgi:dihydroorotate dehydrogenase electron transfer subunit